MNLENGIMNLNVTTSGSSPQNIKITGPLDIMTGNADLSLDINNKKTGTLEVKTQNNSYSIKLTGDYDEDGTKVSFKALYEAIIEMGTFDVIAPKKFEKLNSGDILPGF